MGTGNDTSGKNRRPRKTVDAETYKEYNWYATITDGGPIVMIKYTTGEARERFSEVVNEAAFGKQRVVLTRHGKEIAALIPISDLHVFHELECLIDVEDAKNALNKLKSEGSVTLADLKKELNI